MGIIKIHHIKKYPSINLGYMAHTFRAILADKGLISYGRVCQKGRDEAMLLVISDMPTEAIALILQDYCMFVDVMADTY